MATIRCTTSRRSVAFEVEDRSRRPRDSHSYTTIDIERYQMPKPTQFAAPFIAGLCIALLAVFTLGAAAKPEPPANMSIEVVPVMLGGILITVTDHTKNKAYMYIAKNENRAEEDADIAANDKMPLPELVGTIDLSSAGREKLTAEIKSN